MQSDAELVERMARGEQHALGELFSRHASRLLSIGVAIVGEPSEAEDVLHDVFMEAFRRARSYRSDRGQVYSWLAIRMRSRSLDRRKSNAPRQHILEEAVLATERAVTMGETETQMGVHALDHRNLSGALRSLEAQHAEVLMLGYFEDLSCSEIATRLHIPVGTAKSRTRRALILLRQLLQNAKGRTS